MDWEDLGVAIGLGIWMSYPGRFARCWEDGMRQHPRFHFLRLSRIKVTNRLSDERMGLIGDISVGGLRLVSKEPLAVGSCYEMRVHVPVGGGEVRPVDIAVTCRWVRKDSIRNNFHMGFALDRPSQEYVDLVERMALMQGKR